MTVRAKSPSSSRSRRRSSDPEARFQFWVTIGFVALIVVVVLIILGAIAYGYYDAHYRAVASVGGTGITRDQWHDRAALDLYRLEAEEGQIRTAVSAGQISAADGDSRISAIETAKQSVTTNSIEDLIDLIYKGQLAAQQGLSASDADIQAAMDKDGALPERRHVQAIFVDPSNGRPGFQPTAEERQKALTDADAAAAALAAGSTFDEVARQYSTDASKDSGGDYGFITADNSTDATWVQALFQLPQGGTTPVMKGEDGVYRIGKVTEIAAATADPSFHEGAVKAVGDGVYRDNVAREALAAKLEDKVVADATSGDVDQARLAEIFIAFPSGTDATDTDGAIHAGHILYSPKGDPQGVADLPADDPSWADALAKAQKTADELRAITDLDQRQARFAEIAKAESNDTTSGAVGGDLGFMPRTEGLDADFAKAIFDAPNLKEGDIVGPVKSQFGYHVILFHERLPAAKDRLAAVTDALGQPNADFAAIAKEDSDGDEAVNGGELGWRTRQQMPTDAADPVWAVGTGGRTEPLTLDDGYHIYLVEEHANRPLDPQQAAAVRTTAFSDWYDSQKQKAEDSNVITRDNSIFGADSATP